jgi:hypothetical protein
MEVGSPSYILTGVMNQKSLEVSRCWSACHPDSDHVTRRTVDVADSVSAVAAYRCRFVDDAHRRQSARRRHGRRSDAAVFDESILNTSRTFAGGRADDTRWVNGGHWYLADLMMHTYTNWWLVIDALFRLIMFFYRNIKLKIFRLLCTRGCSGNSQNSKKFKKTSNGGVLWLQLLNGTMVVVPKRLINSFW